MGIVKAIQKMGLCDHPHVTQCLRHKWGPTFMPFLIQHHEYPAGFNELQGRRGLLLWDPETGRKISQPMWHKPWEGTVWDGMYLSGFSEKTGVSRVLRAWKCDLSDFMGNRCSQRRNQKEQCPGVPWKNPEGRVLEREAGGRRETRVREPTWPTSHSSGPEDHLTLPGKAETGHLWAFQGLVPEGLGCSSFPETHYIHSTPHAYLDILDGVVAHGGGLEGATFFRVFILLWWGLSFYGPSLGVIFQCFMNLI